MKSRTTGATGLRLTRRPVSRADAQFARVAHHAAYREVAERQFGPWDEERQDRFFAKDWAAATFEMLLWDGVECGYAAIEDRDSDIHVRELVIHPDFQGRGIGTAILRDAMQRATQRSVPVLLGTFVMNDAIRLYTRLGFVEIDRNETHVMMRWVA